MPTSTLESSTSRPLPPSRGGTVCRWIETHCVYGEGDVYGQKVKLRPWQKSIIWRLYETDPAGRRLHKRALIGFPKGNGKTPLAAWITAYELFGAGITNPIIAVGAASFEQADLCFGDFKVSCRESPTLAAVSEVYETEVLIKGASGRAYRVAAARGTNDGARPSCFIADELHEWNDPAKEGAFLVLSNGTTKRADSLQLSITTAGCDLESLLGRLYTYGRQVEAGQVVDDGFLFIWYEAPDTFDLKNPDELRAAIRSCNPAADDFLDVESIARKFHEIPEFEFRRYFLNQWTRSDESWLPPGAWEACRGDTEIPDGAEVVLGVDVALKHDSTAVVMVWPHLGRFVVRAKVWKPGPNGLDIADVMAHVRQLADRYRVLELSYDPRFFDLPAAQLSDEGINCVEFPQSVDRMVPACGFAYEQIVAGLVEHDGDPTLADHVLSAAQRVGERGWTLSKGKSRRKIDACIAMVIAMWEVEHLGSPVDVADNVW